MKEVYDKIFKPLYYFDMFAVRHILEPIFDFLAKITKKDNFYFAEIWLIFVLCGFNSFLVINFFRMHQYFLGFVFLMSLFTICANSLTFCGVFRKVFKIKTRLKAEKDRDTARYYAMKGWRSPLEMTLRTGRLKYLIFSLFFLVPSLFSNTDGLTMWVMASIGFLLLFISFWMYVRSCTPYIRNG